MFRFGRQIAIKTPAIARARSAPLLVRDSSASWPAGRIVAFFGGTPFPSSYLLIVSLNAKGWVSKIQLGKSRSAGRAQEANLR
jgi:hypothetical protein